MEKKIEKITNDLLTNLNIKPRQLTVVTDKEGIFHINLEIDDEDNSLLIGYHGDTINALQLIISLILYKQTGIWNRLLVDIGDYREKRRESLEKIAQNTAKRVKFSGGTIALFDLNSFERRIIHTYLANDPDVTTQSEGEGRNRHLIIKSNLSVKESPPIPKEPQ